MSLTTTVLNTTLFLPLKMFPYDVLCIGSAVIDHFLSFKQPLSKVKLGDKILADSLEVHSGGGATNSAAALSLLGLKVKMFTKLGNDHDGQFILEEMRKYKVKNICKHHSHKRTDFSTLVYSLVEKDRIIYNYKGASQDLSASDLPKLSLTTNPHWIYLASLMGKSFHTAEEIITKKKNIKILFNPSLYLAEKGRKYLQKILSRTSILVLNKEEAHALVGKKLLEKELLLQLQKYGPETVIITNGSKRLFALHQSDLYILTPPNVKVVQTAGAGDAFTSGFLAGIIKNYSFEDALRLGQVNSTSVIQAVGTKHRLLGEKEALGLMGKMRIKVWKSKV